MANKKIIHYSLDSIDSKNANFNIIYGERSNGKSYQVKHKKAVEKYINTGRRFILIRRHKDEITTEKIERYFADVDVEKLTDGRYNCISCYRKELFLSKYDSEKCKTIRYDKIGYVIALVQEQNYAGASFLDVDDIIFEEFMSRGTYLPDEPNKLMNLFCTVDRKRGTTRIWLVGNTISRVCPYLLDWELLDDIRKLEQGDILIKEFIDSEYVDNDNKPIVMKIAVEHCKSTGVSSFTIGTHSNMLSKGEWQTDPQPHLPHSIKEYNLIFRFVFEFSGFRFLCDVLHYKSSNDIVYFIYPKYTEIKPKTLVISDNVRQSVRWLRTPYAVHSFLNEKVEKILYYFAEDKIFFSTDMCGTDFKQAIDFEIRK